MKKIFCILLVFLFVRTQVFAACGGTPTESPAGTWTTYDATYDCVNDAIQNYATAGETVIVEDGSETWSTQLVIDKELTLVGGSGTITLTGGTSISTSRIKVSPSSDVPVDISGFHFAGGWMIWYYNGTAAPFTQMTLHDNQFTQTVDDYLITTSGSPVYGVIYSNTFDYSGGSGELMQFIGKDENWENYQHEYGTSHQIFVEDNDFTATDRIIDSGQGTKGYVARYNDINFDSTSIESAFDQHGDASTWGCGGMVSEVYGNHFTPSRTGSTQIMNDRGSWIIAFFNKREGTGNFYPLLYNDFVNDSGGCPSHPSNPVDEDINNTYYFANLNDDGLGFYSFNSGYPGSEPTLNVDFWIQRSGVFDGSGTTGNGGGVGCGTAAQMAAVTPEILGMGYWVTTQSCSSIGGYVGIAPTSPINGVMYKAVSDGEGGYEWDSTYYYRPFVYPHYLRGGQTVTLTDSDPKNVAASNTELAFTWQIDSQNAGPIVCKWRIGSAPDAGNGTEVDSLTAEVTGLSPGDNTVYVGCYDGDSWDANDVITVHYDSPGGPGSPKGAVVSPVPGGAPVIAVPGGMTIQ